jgi:hypothetical protein
VGDIEGVSLGAGNVPCAVASMGNVAKTTNKKHIRNIVMSLFTDAFLSDRWIEDER